MRTNSFPPTMRKILTALSLASALTLGITPGASAEADPAETLQRRHGIELSPMSFLFRIYAFQYTYDLTERDQLISGFAYQNIQHPTIGTTNSPTLILGYRRYLWDKFHAEYQLWPAYDAYYSSADAKYYNGFELWNEARVGYRFDFEFANVPLFVKLQWLFGFGLWPGNKPVAFLEAEKKERFFTYPLLMMGWKF